MTPLRIALLPLVLLAAPAWAADGDEKPKRFSFGLSVGVRPDMAGIGSTIVQDGSVDVADTSLANLAYSTDKALMSDRNNMTLKANSDKADSIFNVLSDYQAGGSLLGVEVGGDVRYELDDVGLPLFVDAGLYYSSRMSGGQQSRTLGDIAAQSEDLALIAAVYGLDVNDFVGGTMITEWSAAWIEVPISVGIKASVPRPHTFAYGSAGVSVFSGGFDIGIDVDEKYANVLNTHIVDEGGLVPALYDQSPDGGVKDTIKFRTTAVGLNYAVGAQAGLNRHVAIFLEINQSGAAKTVYAQPLGEDTKRLLTSASSQTLADSDPDWFQDIAYPVLMQGASARLGFRAYLF
jgi:hypothetical protein